MSVGKPSIPSPSGFIWTPLSDIARLESGHTPSRRHAEYWDGDVPWIGIKDATGNHGRVITSTLQTITQDGLDNSSARLLPAGTVCLSRTASVGYVVTMGVPMATSQDFINWVCGPQISSRYLHYILVMEQDSVRRFAHGTTHQTVYYPEAKAFHVCIPSRGEQDRIVSVLGSLDDKIAVNERIATAARQLGLTLFARSSLAGDLAQVDVASVSNVLTRGVAPKYSESCESLVVLNQKCIRDGRVNLGPARRTLREKVKAPKLLHRNDVLVNSTGVGTLGRVALWTSDDAATVDSHITIVRFDEARVDPVCAGFALLRAQPEIEAMGEGSTGQTELRRAQLGGLEITLPNRTRQQQLRPKLEALEEQADQALAETLTLAALRDILLPQLMSGRLRVKDAEKIVEDRT
ncbi:restriction endonuclease subunit S [Streptomyces sp. NBC_00483]|uniref:restriction endonuclease subunit S n=1 Tax=Streptomyces sp. NBC_00483 TaxID=2975756 RepID=UPI002E18B340